MSEESRTLYCGNLSSRCNEAILHELFLQGGPLERVHIPKDRDGGQKSFGFITYKHQVSVPYAISLFEGTALYNRTLMLKTRQAPEMPPPQQQQMSMPMNLPFPNPMLQFGNQMFMNQPIPNFGMNMIPMFLPPGAGPYPSQINSSSLVKDDRRSARSHPYNSRDRERDRNRERDRGIRERDRDRYSDYDHGHRNQNHRREQRNHHRGTNDHSRNNRHYR